MRLEQASQYASDRTQRLDLCRPKPVLRALDNAAELLRRGQVMDVRWPVVVGRAHPAIDRCKGQALLAGGQAGRFPAALALSTRSTLGGTP